MVQKEAKIVGSHLVKEVHEVDIEEVVGEGYIFKYLVDLFCGLEVEALWPYTEDELDALDAADKPYDPFLPGQWVDIESTSDGGMRVMPAAKKGGN